MPPVKKSSIPKGNEEPVLNLLDQLVFQRLKRKRPREEDDSDEEDDAASSTTTASPNAIQSVQRTGGWLEKAKLRRETDGMSSTASIAAATSTTSDKKKAGVIRLERCRDLTWPTRHESRVTSLGFITGSIGFSTGLDKCVKIYSLKDRKTLSIEHSVHVKETPIYGAAISREKSNLVCVAQSSTIFTLDVNTHTVCKCPTLMGRVPSDGQYKSIKSCDGLLAILDTSGKIYMLDERTFRTVRIYNSGTRNQCLTMTGNKIYSGDEGGEIFEWDLRLGRCVKRHNVEGSLGVRSLDLSSTNRLLAGTESGYTCLYSLAEESEFRLLKSFGNLRTSVDCIAMSSNLPLALVGSSMEADAVRLFNIGDTPVVYQNFPGSVSTGINKITCGAFSDAGGWMALGNDRGVVKLWKVPSSL